MAPDTIETARPKAGTVLQFSGNSEIYGEGDAADCVFKVMSGVVRTCKFLSDGRRQINAFYVAGDLFGLEAGDVYRLTAEAINDCVLVAYRRSHLEKGAAQDSRLARQMFSHAMRHMVRAQDHALLLGRKTALEKVAAFLTEWAQHSPDSQNVTLEMSRQDMADYLGLTIETVSRTLSQLEHSGVIEILVARQIKIKRQAALRNMNA
ncbi:helix-turn-helix domain-containing protein [Methylovirgula sp. 4M-Z18]|uniref:helix-turn-helix domain-containing protein n=1 Tax=Methylovirgula sp. 4M-Z18 TaxID=2293567 RepID=UPI000E2F11FF|nr:helix-turn-helix domain-containing protein [Methylovirgula sp. 4M-Z18]RFB76475.1 transcriptional regulator [Methylovirgula sp. 4M-Z18]